MSSVLHIDVSLIINRAGFYPYWPRDLGGPGVPHPRGLAFAMDHAPNRLRKAQAVVLTQLSESGWEDLHRLTRLWVMQTPGSFRIEALEVAHEYLPETRQVRASDTFRDLWHAADLFAEQELVKETGVAGGRRAKRRARAQRVREQVEHACSLFPRGSAVEAVRARPAARDGSGGAVGNALRLVRSHTLRRAFSLNAAGVAVSATGVPARRRLSDDLGEVDVQPPVAVECAADALDRGVNLWSRAFLCLRGMEKTRSWNLSPGRLNRQLIRLSGELVAKWPGVRPMRGLSRIELRQAVDKIRHATVCESERVSSAFPHTRVRFHISGVPGSVLQEQAAGQPRYGIRSHAAATGLSSLAMLGYSVTCVSVCASGR